MEEQLYQETVDKAISRGDVELLAVLYKDSLQYGSFGKKIRKEIDSAAYDIAQNADIPFPRISFKEVVAKWDGKAIEELLEKGDLDQVAEYASKRLYVDVILGLLEKHPVATPEDLAKVAYPLLSLRVNNEDLKQIDNIIKLTSDYISTNFNPQARRVITEPKTLFYIALGELIAINENYDLYFFLKSKGPLVSGKGLFMGVNPYRSFSDELARRKKELENK